MSFFKSTLWFVVAIMSVANSLSAQETAPVFFPIEKQENQYQGAGIEWILNRSDTTQFVLFGEQHGVDGIAEFITFIYESLQEKNFNYLVLETDGWTTQRSADLGVIPFTKQYPHSIAFDSDGDLKLMQTAIDKNPDLQTPIWGVDQMQTAIHPFFRLIDIANSPKQRRLARGAFLKASLKMGRYTRQDHQADILVLEKVFANNKNDEKDRIFRELKLTIEIFSMWMNPETRQESVAKRERLMDQNFDIYIEQAPEAKAVFKMGGAHTLYGIGPNGISTFGNHVSQVVQQRGQSVLSLSILRWDPDRSQIKESDFGANEILLVDTKAALMAQPDDSSKLIQRDAIIYLRGVGYASKSVNRPLEQAFRNKLIYSILPLGIGLLICIIMFFSATIAGLAWKKYRNRITVFNALGTLFLLSIVGLQLVQILQYPNHTATISMGILPTIFYICLATISVVYCYHSIKILQNQSKSRGSKIGYLIFTSGFIMSSYFVYYWNMAGMLD